MPVAIPVFVYSLQRIQSDVRYHVEFAGWESESYDISVYDLPALNQASFHAKLITCLNNQRQMAVGLLLYANDSDGYWPQRDANSNSHNAQTFVLTGANGGGFDASSTSSSEFATVESFPGYALSFNGSSSEVIIICLIAINSPV